MGRRREFLAVGRDGPIGSQTDAALRRLPILSELDPCTIERLVRTRRVYESGSILFDEHMLQNARPKLLLSGWACRQRIRSNGRRIIFSFLLPGDIMGSHLAEPKCGSSIASTIALTQVTAVDVHLTGEANRASAIFTNAMSFDKSKAEALLHDQIMRVGCMSSMESMAHLLLELNRRLLAVGLAGERWLSLPLSQEVLGDALGLTAVHVNRTLQQLRREKSIEYRDGRVTLLNLARLEALANGSSEREGCGGFSSQRAQLTPPPVHVYAAAPARIV